MALSTRTQLFKEGRRYPMDKSLSSRYRCIQTPCVIHQIAIYPENSIIHHSINQVQTASTHYKLLFSVERNISLFFANQNKGAFLYTILEGNTHFFLADILLYFSPARKTIIWTVFPRPISSPIIPPACWQWSSHNHFTPVCWYLEDTRR